MRILENFQKKLSKNSGFTLVEMAIVMVIASLVFTAFLSVLKIYYVEKREVEAKEKISSIKSGFIRFVADDPDDPSDPQRFPCPASLTAARGSAGFSHEIPCGPAITALNLTADDIGIDLGTENAAMAGVFVLGGSNGNLALVGTIPTSTLEIASDSMLDVYGNKYLYSVTLGLVDRDDAYLNGKPSGSITIMNETGAAAPIRTQTADFVVVSAGRDQAGSYTAEGFLNACRNTDEGDARNCAWQTDSRAIFREQKEWGFDSTGEDYYDDTVEFDLSDNPEQDGWWRATDGSKEHIIHKNTRTVQIGADVVAPRDDDNLIVRGNHRIFNGSLVINSDGTNTAPQFAPEDAWADSFRIFQQLDRGGGTGANHYGTSRNNSIIFENQDANNWPPDDSMHFVNTGRDVNGVIQSRTAMTIAGNGRVGIGTNVPAQEFHVVNGNTAGGDNQTVMQLGEGPGSLLLGHSLAHIAGNARYDDGNWRYIADGFAGSIEFKNDNKGGMSFFMAPHGVAGSIFNNTRVKALEFLGNGDLLLGEDDVSASDKLGYGSKLHFLGKAAGTDSITSKNTDEIYLARFNESEDKSQLRLFLGDNTHEPIINVDQDKIDSFVIGGTNFLAPPGLSSFKEVFRVQSDGTMKASGDIKVGSTTPDDAVCKLGQHGSIRYNSEANEMEFCAALTAAQRKQFETRNQDVPEGLWRLFGSTGISHQETTYMGCNSIYGATNRFNAQCATAKFGYEDVFIGGDFFIDVADIRSGGTQIYSYYSSHSNPVAQPNISPISDYYTAKSTGKLSIRATIPVRLSQRSFRRDMVGDSPSDSAPLEPGTELYFPEKIGANILNPSWVNMGGGSGDPTERRGIWESAVLGALVYRERDTTAVPSSWSTWRLVNTADLFNPAMHHLRTSQGGSGLLMGDIKVRQDWEYDVEIYVFTIQPQFAGPDDNSGQAGTLKFGDHHVDGVVEFMEIRKLEGL